ncbi:MAG: hypothetical protein K2Y02_01955 [Burkholderiaceae bacterium]|nr:hypothetical protein [Burkholderiaceae bacterium]
MTTPHDGPMAVPGLTSFRCRSPYGWIMIGATGADDALREAGRSTESPRREDLQIWNGDSYVDVEAPR